MRAHVVSQKNRDGGEEMIRDVLLLAEIAVMVVYTIKLYIGRASAEKRVELVPSKSVGRRIPAGKVRTSVQPPRPRKPEVTPEQTLFELDKHFFGGKIGSEEYLKSRKDLVARLQAGPHETKEAETGEMGEGDLEILKLASEKKTVMSIAIRLLKDPEEVSRKIEELIKERYLKKDMSLTEQGAKVFGKREVQSRKIEEVREEASELTLLKKAGKVGLRSLVTGVKEAVLFLLTGVMFLMTGVLLLVKIYNLSSTLILGIDAWILTLAFGVVLVIITGYHISRARRFKT